jgi:hypothetical protein
VELAQVTRAMLGLLESTLPSPSELVRNAPARLPTTVLDPLYFE